MIEGMGVRNLIVEADNPWGESKRDTRKHSAGLSMADALAMSDTLPFVEDWAGVRRISVWDLFSHQGQGHAEAWAVSPSYFGMTQLDAGAGVLFGPVDDERFAQVAVLGGNVANQLFPRGGAVGGLVKVNPPLVRGRGGSEGPTDTPTARFRAARSAGKMTAFTSRFKPACGVCAWGSWRPSSAD